LDYNDWKKAVLIKQSCWKENKKNIQLNDEKIQQIMEIKNQINNFRSNFEGYSVNSNMISKHLLIGFIEVEGSIHFSNSSAVYL
jgi:hypothetical protein